LIELQYLCTLMTDFVTNMTDQKHHEKYDSTNPIVNKMVDGFMDHIKNLVLSIKSNINSVTECGCGQGQVNQYLERLLPHVLIKELDINLSDLTVTKGKESKSITQLRQKNIYELSHNESAGLIVCCEVLEHLQLRNWM